MNPIETQTKKYREVEQVLRREILEGKWAEDNCLPAAQVLAKRFSVANMTIRQAVTSLVEEGLLVRVQGKGTFIVEQEHAPEAPTTRFPMALLVPPDWKWKDQYYFGELLDGFQQVMQAGGHRTSRFDYDVVENPGVLETGAAIACIILEEPHLELVERLRDRGYRVLAVNHYTGRRSIPCIRVDDIHAVEEAVDHLVAKGHERIGFLRGVHANIDAKDRLRGFRAAARRHNLRSAPEMGDDFSESSGYDAAQRLLSSPNPPTAIVCASDLSAIGAIRAVRDRGLSVPHDLSVVGYGNFSVADYVIPRLTTMRQPRMELGAMAAEMLIRLANDEVVDDVLLNAEMMVRESTTRPVSVLAAV
ncbi:MAG: GntR family transcriptional regulator [Capsulimonas sp.]|uniref:GntR family transcriptional regulator n=1 Tax=Capsulimonas sp. TaxID=2494211 RepID=UPI00326689D5